MNKFSQKLISLSNTDWNIVENILGIKIPKSDFSYSRANPFVIFKEVVRDKNRKWLLMMAKAILEFYNLKINKNEEKCYIMCPTHTALHDPEQIERTREFLNDLYESQKYVYENKRNYPEFFQPTQNEQASSH